MVPDYLQPYCRLTREEIVADGDEGAREIYAGLEQHVAAFVTTDVARAIVDMNRAEDDRRKDGVVKTHTCWDVKIYDPAPPEELLRRVIAEYHHPYHDKLSAQAREGRALLGLDCHTMAVEGPPVGPDAGRERPLVCIGDGDGEACRKEWVERMRECMQRYFPGEVTVNLPFKGAHTTRFHGREMPWMQLELSRTPKLDTAKKRDAVLRALTDWCAQVP
jgi:formiminoglutamase